MTTATRVWVLDGPWDRGALRLSALRLLVGPIGIEIAWYGASGSKDWKHQQIWMAVGVIAVVIAITGVTGWLRTGLRNVRHFERLLLGSAGEQVTNAFAGDVVAAQPTSGDVVVIAGTMEFHTPGCLLTADRSLQHLNRAEASGGQLYACGMCTP